MNYGDGDEELYYESLSCIGNETNIEECNQVMATGESCNTNTSFIAGVDCSGENMLYII